MNAYVHPDNQRLLWTTVNSVPIIANLPNDFKAQWFKDIVKIFYEKNPHITDKSILQQVNKQTVQYMMQSAKSILSASQMATHSQQHSQPPQQPPQQPPPSSIGITSEFTRYDTDSKKNTEWYNRAFAERQKEYEIMHAKPLAPEVNFAIKMDDTPLNNMDELIEKHRKDRETDMNVFPSSSSSPPSLVAQQTSSPSPISLLITEIQKIKKEMEELRKEMEDLKSKKSSNVQDVVVQDVVQDVVANQDVAQKDILKEADTDTSS